jgi:DNA-binding HxlR family transcriptional regulator
MIHLENMRSQCAIANALDVLGDRWTLLIIRDLMFTNRREFGHFLKSGEGISTNILSDRLEKLQCCGIISKHPHPEHGKKYIYDLTEQGLRLAPTIIEFTLWSIDSIENALVPPKLLLMMREDRQTLLSLINKRECLVAVEL